MKSVHCARLTYRKQKKITVGFEMFGDEELEAAYAERDEVTGNLRPNNAQQALLKAFLTYAGLKNRAVAALRSGSSRRFRLSSCWISTVFRHFALCLDVPRGSPTAWAKCGPDI